VGGYRVKLRRDPVTGSPRQVTKRGFTRRKDAVAARAKIVSDRAQGIYFEPSKQSLGEFLVGEWLPARRGQLRPTTFEAYRINVECHVVPRLGSVPISGLTTARLNEFYGELREGGRRDGSGKGLSEQTVRNVHAILRKALADAAKEGKILRNPAEYASPPRPDRPEMTIWTGEELGRFLRLIVEDRLYPLYLLVATSGMRRGEVLGLRWSDVDLEKGSLEIRRALVAVSHRDVQVGPLKSRKGKPKSRNVPLDSRTVAAIRTHKRRQTEERLE
jgi:integrase